MNPPAEEKSIFVFLDFSYSYFDAQMSGIKFWKSDENQRPVYKKINIRNLK
jgi:hypothetical protein